MRDIGDVECPMANEQFGCCIGQGCAGWRTRGKAVVDGKTVKPPGGYCGYAGPPSEEEDYLKDPRE